MKKKEKISAIRKTYEKYYIKKEVICLSSSRKSVPNDVYGTLFIFWIDSNKANMFKENLYKSIGKDAFFDILVYFEGVVVILSPQYPVFNALSKKLSEFFQKKRQQNRFLLSSLYLVELCLI